ncbi:blue copper protein 1a-like [Mangifera indica]|uniref:blue copper protein 1a-like n=1 Tax=Mangifera indica TaxID=29780 RepID=UPI001CFAC908|nr:blue copper protein 1a-like [Mangifera indica]
MRTNNNVFKYAPPNHNVFKVNGSAFNNCVVPSSNLALSTGNDIITLSTPGNKWYICGEGTGDKKHCELGQKLAITAVEGVAPSAAFKIVSSASSLVDVAAVVLVTFM